MSCYTSHITTLGLVTKALSVILPLREIFQKYQALTAEYVEDCFRKKGGTLREERNPPQG
jgi:hypothetical protein